MDPDRTSPPTAAVPRPGRPEVRAVQVDVIAGPDAGLGVRAEGDRMVVGTHPSADLVLGDPTVSRFHCELAVDGDGLLLRDLGSRNGTIIDSVAVEVGRLRGPTIMALGNTELRVDLLAETVELELSPREQFGDLVGVSPAMRRAFELLGRAARRDGNVLIEGEPGTGKDAAATALHEASSRAGGPLDVIDCGAAAALEVEAELLGGRDRPGALERCRGGTLVLDDVSSLVRGTQRELLRAIETRQVRRPGGSETVDTDVRIVALSRRDLFADVNDNRFRPELYHALCGARIRLPPLRERPEDIPLLASRVLESLGVLGTPAAAQLLSADSIEQLRAAPWAGNVRELRAYLERAVVADSELDDAHEPPLVDGSLPLRIARKRWSRYFERAYLRDLLEQTGGNVSAAAIIAGVDRVHIHRLLKRCGLRD